MYYLEGKNNPVTPRVRLVKDDKWPVLMVDIKKDDAPYNRDLFQRKTFEISGLALEFSRIRKDRDIVDFANKYGLLGVNSQENMSLLEYDYHYLNDFQFDEKSAIEFLEEWYWHVQHINKLFKLFDALQNSQPIEEKILRLDKRRELYPPVQTKEVVSNNSAEALAALRAAWDHSRGITNDSDKKQYIPPEFHVYWVKDMKPTLLPYIESGDESSVEDEYRQYAWLILETHIKSVIEKAIFIDFSSIRSDNRSAFGFSYTDRKATKYLLAAIYYDLYRIVNNIDEVISFCSVCSGPFKSKRKGTIYCSNACKQEKKRQLKEGDSENG